MRKIILAAVVLVGGLAQAQKVNLTVEMSGFKTNDGIVRVGLYNSEETFLKKTVKSLPIEIKDGKAKAIFAGIDKGEYAVSIYHDENNNGMLDRNVMGIPTEGYASSNDAKGFMGPPAYSDAKFTVQANASIKMTINN